MSTKTSIKRIALVAVSALGLGVLTSVAPATAAITDNAVSAGASAPARVGVSSGDTVVKVVSATTDTGFVLTAQITSAPSTSSKAELTFSAASTNAAANATYTDTSTATGSSLATLDATGVASASFDANATTGATTTSVKLSLKADVAGTYQILVTNNGSTSTGYSTGKKSTSYTITTAGAPTSLTAASYGGVVTTSGRYGQLMSLSLKDANGNATILGLNESIDITSSTTAVTFKDGTTSAGSAITSFGSASANSSGKYYYRVVNTGTAIAADTTATITFAGAGLLSPSLTTNTTATLKKAVLAASGTAITVACTTAANCTSSTGAAWSSGSLYTTGAQGLTFSVLNTGSTTDVVHATEVSDALGYKYNSTATVVGATTANTTSKVTAPAVADGGANVTVTILAGNLDGATSTTGNVTATLIYKVAAAYAIAVSGTDTVLSATGGKTTWNIKATDQYGKAIQYVPVSVTVSGRNTVAAKSLGVTDANGFISYSLTDAGTTGTKDTLVFSSGSLSDATAYVTYGTVTVDKVTIKGGNNTTTGVAAATAQWKDIDAGEDGASTTTHDVIATVKDASGNLLAGVPVTFTVSGTGAAITSTTATVTTSSAGTATAQVYAWVAGKYTVTATAGGKTGTSDYQFRQAAAGEERTLSATVNGNLVTAKVVDRFGNGVPSVKIWASVTGGYLGTGSLKTTDTTDNDGVVSFIVNGGASSVTLATYDATAGSATPGSGQTCARAGAVDCNADAADDTAFTATVAGTTTKDETGVGASFAPAGTASVTVDVAAASSSDAIDAANEATDAANAATDAANAAAEAADAATAAAQDAQAAVAALATEVAAMISGIKAQIIRLTNLVVKIQKKVKA